MLAVMIIEFETFSWSGLIIYVLVTFLVLLVFFWVGIIFVYTEDYAFNMYKIPAVYAGDYFDMSLEEVENLTPGDYARLVDKYFNALG